MIETGFKVFHFGCAPEYRGRWLTAADGPGFHIWLNRETAEKYRDKLHGGEVREVKFQAAVHYREPLGPAVTAQSMFIL